MANYKDEHVHEWHYNQASIGQRVCEKLVKNSSVVRFCPECKIYETLTLSESI